MKYYKLPITKPLSLPLIQALYFYVSNFGVKAMFQACLMPRICTRLKLNPEAYLHGTIKYINSICNNTRKKYQNFNFLSNCAEEENFIIWVMWWQGFDEIPETIKLCINSLQKNAKGHKIIFLSEFNFSEYIQLPDYILTKISTGLLSITHISDIIRTCILAKYGGLWIDAGLFVTKPIEVNCQYKFYSPKMNYSISVPNNNKWTVGCMYCSRNFKLFEYVRDMLFEFLEKKPSIMDYFQLDYIIKSAYLSYPDVKHIIDMVELNNENIHDSRYSFGNVCDKNKFDFLIKNNTFLSLTWRFTYPEMIDGKKTYFSYLKEL